MNLIIPFLADIRRVWTGAMARASLASATMEPWNFSASPTWTLLVQVNGGAVQTVTIPITALADPAMATASELASVISVALPDAGAYAMSDGTIVIEADLVTATTSLRVTGGTANALLIFSTIAETQGGYNDLLGGVRAVVDSTQTGIQGRREHATVTVRCQVDRSNWGEQQMTPGGAFNVAELVLTLDMRELERRGLTRSDGAPRFTRGDRLERIRTIHSVSVEAFTDVRVENIERAGHGLSLTNPRPNLVYLHCTRDRVTP